MVETDEHDSARTHSPLQLVAIVFAVACTYQEFGKLKEIRRKPTMVTMIRTV